ncbi:MAG: hypothetical protein QM691_17090 [Opitutaceae bacterium]
MIAILHWLGASVPRYFAVVSAAGALLIVLAVAPAWRARWWNSAPVFAAGLLLALLAVRWPSTAFNAHLFNPDESQALAGAMAYEHDAAPWRAADLHTAGPLSAYALLAFARLTGRALDFTTARLLALLCLWGGVVGLWRMFRRVGTDTAARVLVLPLIPVLSATFSDLAQFNNEHLTILFLAIALCAFSPLLLSASSLGRWRLVAAGLALGAVPLAKLQAAPPALWLGLAAVFLLARRPEPRRARVAACGWLILAALLPVTVLALACQQAGTLDLAVDAYFGNNAAYLTVREFAVAQSVSRLFAMARTTTTLEFVLWPALVALPVGLGLAPRFAAPARRLFWLSAGWFGASVAAALLPGRMYYHYLLLVLCPAAAVAGSVVLGVASVPTARRAGRWSARGRAALWTLWATGAVLPAILGMRYAVALAAPFFGGFAVQRSQLAADILSVAEPGDRLGIWGWAPRLYVETGLAPATREAHTEREIETWGHRDVYRRRYLAELRRERPAVFLDTTGPFDARYHDPVAEGVGSFPALAGWLGRHYEIVAESESVRIYLRRDRIARIADPRVDLRTLRGVMDPPPLGFAGASFALESTRARAIVTAPLPCRFDWPAAARVRVCQVRFSAVVGTGNRTASGSLRLRATAHGDAPPFELPLNETAQSATGTSADRLRTVEFVVPADTEFSLEFIASPEAEAPPPAVQLAAVCLTLVRR